MKENKPIYESPRVFKLDDTESAFGACNPGSTPGDSCSMPGHVAEGACADGYDAGTMCTVPGHSQGMGCSPQGNSPD